MSYLPMRVGMVDLIRKVGVAEDHPISFFSLGFQGQNSRMRFPSPWVDPDRAISVHLDWKLALHEAVQTGRTSNLDPEALARHDLCELGQWLESPLACCEGSEEMRLVHRRFHALAGLLVRRLQEGTGPDTVTALRSQLEDQSAKLVNRLGSAAQAGAPRLLATT